MHSTRICLVLSRESVFSWFVFQAPVTARELFNAIDPKRTSVDLIGHAGRVENLPLLRWLTDDAEIRKSAIKAIQLIERQPNSMSG